MRVAALYDIHGNLPALEAVLEEIDTGGVEHVIIGGDVVPGPMPRETLDCLRSLGEKAHFIQGNGELDVLTRANGGDIRHLPEPVREVIAWVADELQADLSWVASWPRTLRFHVFGLGQVLFCHATPGSATDIFTKLTPEDRLKSAFRDVGADMVVCGHTHMQFSREIGGIRVVNAGSVGMPFGERGAHWLLLGQAVEFRRTPYDIEAGAKRMQNTQYPGIREFVARYVLAPPNEAEMLAVFERTASS